MKKILLTCFSLLIVVSTMAQNPRGVPGPDPTTERSFNNLYALIIGVSDYESTDIKKLNYADDDARLFFTYLKTFYKDDLEKSDKLHYKLLIDKEASRESVIKGFGWLKDNAKKNDLVVIYFAGHGNAIGRDAYFYCHNTVSDDPDASAMRFQKIKETLDVFAANSIQSIFIADACHAGLMKSNFSRMNTFLAPEDEDEAKPKEKQAFGHKLLSSTGSQVSIEGPDLCNGHGYFTYYLIKGLLGEADAENPGTSEKDGRITIQELRLYIDKKLHAKIGAIQTPVVFSQNPDFIVGRKFEAIPGEFTCLLEEGTSSGFAYSEAKDEKIYTRKKLTKEQSIVYDSFLKSLSEKHFLSPVENNTIYFFEKLIQANTASEVISEISEQWKSAFSEYAQFLVNKYLENGKLPSYEEYEYGSRLVKKYLEYSKSNNADHLELKAKQVFLESYALHLKYFQGLLIMPESHRQQLYEKQIEKLEALTNKTDLSYIQCVLGRMYLEVGNKDKAKKAYTRASVLAPNWAFPIYNLLSLKSKMDVKLKLNEYLRINELYPDFIEGYLTLAVTYRNSKIKMPEKSLKLLEAVLQRALLAKEDKSVIANIYNGIGRHYWSQKDYKKAEEYFLKAITENKGCYVAYYNLTEMFRGIGQYDLAIEYAQKGLNVNPYDDDLLVEIAWVNMDLKKYGESEVWLKKKMEYDSLNSYSYFTLARVNKFSKKWSLAENFAQRGLKIAEEKKDSTEMARCLTELGSIKSEQEEYTAATPYFEQAIEIDSTEGSAYYFMAFNYQYWKKYDEAIKYFKKYGNLGFDIEENVAYIKSLQGKPKEAITYYKAASRKDPKNSRTLNNIAIVYNQIGKKDSAVFFSEKAVFNNDYFESKDYQGLYSYYMNKVKSEDSKMAYYALGLIWERGLGREKNLVEAVRWYKYAAQMIYWAAADRLIYLYNQGKFSEKNVRIKEFWQKATTGKKFTVPSLLPDGEKIPVDIYITNFPLNEDNPLEAEVFRAKDIHNAQVPDEVVTSFKKLYDIAKENNVGFEDLCVYALGEANKVNKNQNQVIEAHIDYEREAQRFDPISHADSVLINTEKAIINKYNIYIKKDFVGAYNWVVKEIVSNNQNDNFLLYYVLGYLYETSPTNKNINKAIQWYMYAFQMGYKPAYVKLRRLFKFISESKVEWLDKNYLKKPAETNITAYDGNGKSIQKKIYLLDFPVNYLNPLQHEEDRLKDVFGLTLNKETVESFRSIYNTAKNNNVSFQDHYFKKVVEFERNKVKSEDQKYLESGISLYLKKNYIEAYEQFSLAIRFNPKNSKAYFYRGAISFAQNEYQKSAVDFEKALAIEPDDKDYNLILGGCYIELKNYKKAKEYYERAYELGNNKNNILCYNLACIYSVDKRSVKALRFFEEALENGYRNFDHIKKDTDLDYIRDISRFRELVEKYSKK